MTDPRFAIVVTTYDRPAMLTRCLASIAAQTVADFECVVVDDASGTAAQAIPDDPRFRIVDLDDNIGENRARQVGVDASRGQVVCFLDDDDVWTRNRLALAEAGLRSAPIAICWSRWADDPEPRRGRDLNGDVADSIVDSIAPSLGATAVRRDVMVPFDPSFRANGDTEWWIRQAGVSPVATVARVVHLVGRHDGPRHGNADDARLAASHQLLDVHRAYFERRRRARAFRWYRIAMLQATVGDRPRSRKAAVRSLTAWPTPRAALQLLRASRPIHPKRDPR